MNIITERWKAARRKLADWIAPCDYYRFPAGFCFPQKISIPGVDPGAVRPSDISDHLANLFYHALCDRPKLIVELGTRGGESSRVLFAAAKLAGAKMLSVDIDDCSTAIEDPAWSFVRADDVEFGRNHFEAWCEKNGVAPEISVLYIDTSHEYEHTCRELEIWTPRVAPRGKIILHDTHTTVPYYRLDNSKGFGQDFERGVVRAVNSQYGLALDETAFHSGVDGDFLFINYPYCNGLCVVKKMV